MCQQILSWGVFPSALFAPNSPFYTLNFDFCQWGGTITSDSWDFGDFSHTCVTCPLFSSLSLLGMWNFNIEMELNEGLGYFSVRIDAWQRSWNEHFGLLPHAEVPIKGVWPSPESLCAHPCLLIRPGLWQGLLHTVKGLVQMCRHSSVPHIPVILQPSAFAQALVR